MVAAVVAAVVVAELGIHLVVVEGQIAEELPFPEWE